MGDGLGPSPKNGENRRMPPRYAYWTILVGNQPTAFRAREREELLPTLNQLRRKNADAVMKWFARGRLWDSPEAERAGGRRPKPPQEKRGQDWRPGGQHKDPRDRFRKKHGDTPGAAQSFRPAGTGDRNPWRDKPAKSPQGHRPWSRHPSSGPARSDRWRDKSPERREAAAPSKRPQGAVPEPRSAPEQIGTKPKPPERD